MEISHIVPTDLLYLIEGRRFYMCLANIAFKNNTYLDFYKKQVERGAFVLLDNGAAENDQMTLDQMWEVISKLNPNEVVLSDCLYNGKQTIKNSKKAIAFYRKKGYRGQFMFVPQGKCFREWSKCLVNMDMSDVSTIGISKFVTSRWDDEMARQKCCDFIQNNMIYFNSNIQVHLLGCNTCIKEPKIIEKIFEYEELPIRSNDTAIAYIYSLNHQDVLSGDRPKGEINFINHELDSKGIECLKNNIVTFDTYEI